MDIGSVEADPAGAESPTTEFDGAVADARRLHGALSSVLLGTPRAVTIAVVAAMSGNHLLIEDVPGVGKTVLARALATALGVELSRVQGHPDLLPTDVTGVTVFSPDTGTWEFRPGPVFGHVVLLDELNRTPAPQPSRPCSRLWRNSRSRWTVSPGRSPGRTWSSGRRTRSANWVRTRWWRASSTGSALSTTIGYPDAAVETQLVLHNGGRYALDALAPVSDPARWQQVIDTTASVQVVTSVAEYAVTLVRATRSVGTVRLGASPRAAISLIRSAQAYAVLSGRAYVTPQDIQVVGGACLAHRLITEGGDGDGITLVARIIADTPVPPT